MIHLIATLVVVLLTPWPVMAQGTEWYFSDGAAIRYAATSEQVGRASEWALSILKSPGLEHVIHYRDGRPVTTWLRTLDSSGQVSREAVEEDGRILEERLFSPGQQLDLERFFLSNGSIEEIRYVRDGRRIISSTQFKDGSEASTRYYLYYPDGSLAGVREQTTSRLMSTGMERPRSGQTSSWVGTPEGLILSVYDNSGRLVQSRNYKGAVLVSTEERTWRDGKLVSISTEKHEDGTRVVLSYDEAGRVGSRIESRGTEILAFFEFEYDQNDRLVRENRETAGKIETLEYVYNSEGRLLSETIALNGLLTLSRTYSDPDEMIEEYYDKGRMFARVLYKGGRKVKETILSDGKPVRERNF